MAKSAPRQVLQKSLTGIKGFDEISLGGLPRNRTTLVMGGPGTGKSVSKWLSGRATISTS